MTQRFRCLLAVLTVAACSKSPTPPVAQPPQVFPDKPIEMAQGTTVAVLTYIGPSWESPQPSNGVTCSSRDATIVAVSSDCIALAVASAGSTQIVVQRYGATTDVPVSVSANSHFRLADPRPGIGPTEAPFFTIGAQGTGYVTGLNLNGEQYLWRIDVPHLSADSALFFNGQGISADAINAAGTRLYAAGFDNGVVVVDVPSNTIIDTIPGVSGNVYTALLAPDDSTLYLGTDGHVLALDVRSQAILVDLPEPNALVVSLALDAPRNRLYAVIYTGYQTGSVVELDATTLAVQRTVAPAQSGAKGVFLPGGGRLYIASESTQLLDCPVTGSQACNVVPEPFCLGNDVLLNTAGTAVYLGCGGLIRDLDPATLETRRFLLPAGQYQSWRLQARAGVGTVALSGFDLTLLP